MNGGARATVLSALQEGATTHFQMVDKIFDALADKKFEVVERSSLDALREAVESRASIAAMALVIENAKVGDYISNWPVGLSPPTGWRKESNGETSRITKER